MACDPKTYKNVTETIMNGIRTELAKIDLVLPKGDRGSIVSTAYNVTADYNWKYIAETLTIIVKTKPFFVPCSYIFKKFDEALEKARANV